MPDPVVYAEVPPDAEVGIEVALDQDDVHHLGTVLRMERGDPLVVGDGRGRMWPAELRGSGTAVLTAPASVIARRRPTLRVIQGLPKGRAMEDVIRMLVELGVERITPVASERTVRELRGSKRQREHERWEAVALAAARQSRRSWLPRVDALTDLREAAGDVAAGIVPHVGVSAGLADVAPSLVDQHEVAVAVGPEGGWTDDEVATWQAAGLVPVSLGDSVLRTEHAAFAACAALGYALGRMDG